MFGKSVYQIGAAYNRREKRQEQERKRASAPNVGDLASYGHGSDSYPYTVIAVSNTGYKVTLQARSYKLTSNNSFEKIQKNALTWEDPNGAVIVATRRKNGAYKVGRRYAHQPSVYFGAAIVAQDPHF